MSRKSQSFFTAAVLAAALGLCAYAQAADAPKAAAGKKSVRFDAARCKVPDSLISQDQPLTHVAYKLRNDLPIKIVAVGSSSTAGHGASGPSYTYPARLAVELSELWPRAQLTVVNRGVGGDRTAQMIARFERDVIAEKPDLVIWQVGTNDSLVGDTIDSMRDLVLKGIDRLETAGFDVILMSPQYAPRFNEKADHLLRVEAVRASAREKHIGVFRRFEIMQNWIARDNMTIGTMVSGDGLHMNDLSYGCTAHLLARQIAAASSAIPAMAIKQPAPMPSTAPAAMATRPMPASTMTAPVVGSVAIGASPVAAQAVMPHAAPETAPIVPNTLR